MKNNEYEVKYHKEFSVIENDNGISIETEIELHGITKIVSILLTTNANNSLKIEQCKTIFVNFLKMFDGEKFGIIPMRDIVEQTDFSSIVLDYKNDLPTLLVDYGSEKVLHYGTMKAMIEFNEKWEIEKWGFVDFWEKI